MTMQQFLAFTGNAFPPEALEQLMAMSRAAGASESVSA